MTPSSPESAIPTIVELFWRKGYAQTSMAEIVDATGMNRYALYSSLGNKREIFLAALDAYFNEGREIFAPILQDTSNAPLNRIRNCMTTYADHMEEKKNGCFICHVATQEMDHDPEIKKAVHSYIDKILGYIESAMSDAEADGSLNPNLTPKMAAQIAFDAEMSMGIYAKAAADRATLDRIIDNTIAAISAPQAAVRETAPQT